MVSLELKLVYLTLKKYRINMKSLYIVFAFLMIGIANSQTKQAELQEISYELERKQKLKVDEIQELLLKNWNPKVVKKEFQGKYGNFLTFIEEHDQTQIMSMDAHKVHQGTNLGVSATGEGITVYQWDGGRVRSTHQEFENRVQNLESEDTSISSHSTAVASVIMGKGVVPEAKGLAFKANLKAYNFADNLIEIAQESANNPTYMVSNHSYGYRAGWKYGYYDDTFGSGWYWFGYPELGENESVLHGIYSHLDSIADRIAYNAKNHLMIRSAGNDRNNAPHDTVTYHYALKNDNTWARYEGVRPANCGVTGFDCIPYGAMSKNILLVGSIDELPGDGSFNNPNDAIPSYFSSFGPTDDGRVKPDVVAQGAHVTVATANSDDSYYSLGRGTSFSSPAVTGVAALLQEIYNKTYGGYMSADLLKAIILHTANDLGEKGPDYKFGYGLVDAYDAASFIVNAHNQGKALIYTEELNNAETNIYNIKGTASEEIKATLVWIDPPSKQQAFELNNRAKVLVNDLNMTIEDVNGNKEFPWILDVENPSQPATKGINDVDNVEQIVFTPSSTEEFKVKINVANQLYTPQSYALIVSGAEKSNVSTNDLFAKNKIEIYPNPAQNFIKFKGDFSDNIEVKIYSTDGKLVKENIIKNVVKKLSISDLSKGVYIVIIKLGENHYTHKLIKN